MRFRLTPQNLPALAAFMARARPQWWDEAGAAGQLFGHRARRWHRGLASWQGVEAHPAGWLLCRELFLYRCLEVECCGFFEQGRFFSRRTAWARCLTRLNAMRAQRAAQPCAPPWAQRVFPFMDGLWGRSGGNFRPSPPPAGRTFTGCSPKGFARRVYSRMRWAAIFTACFSQKSSDAPQHKAARGARQLRVPRAALLSLFLESAPCTARFAEQKIIFPHPSPPAPFCAWRTRARPFQPAFSAMPLSAAVYPGNRHTQNEEPAARACPA